MDLTGFDFLDLGCSPESMNFAKRSLGGKRGLGIDINPKRIEEMHTNGLDCILRDITELDLPNKAVRFVSMSHVLEHLPGPDAVRAVLQQAVRVATDFIFVCGPCFDDCETLRRLGLKFYWADWIDHPYHLTTAEIREMFADLGLNTMAVTGSWRVGNSAAGAVHPLASPANQNEYDPSRHPPKPFVKFARPICQEMACYIPLRPLPDFARLVRARHGLNLLTVSSQTDLLLQEQESLGGAIRSLLSKHFPGASRRVWHERDRAYSLMKRVTSTLPSGTRC